MHALHDGSELAMTGHRPSALPPAARRAAWSELWDKLLQPPRREPAESEHVLTPEEVADPEPRSRGEGGRR